MKTSPRVLPNVGISGAATKEVRETRSVSMIVGPYMGLIKEFRNLGIVYINCIQKYNPY